MRIIDQNWRSFLLRVAVLGVVVFVAVRTAHAWEGTGGVEARSFLTVAGTLTGVPSGATPTLHFVFHKAGVTAPCESDAATVSLSGAAFSAQVPYDACGRGFFDGANVTVDVLVNGTAVVTAQPLNPVPYAQFADQAASAAPDGGLDQRLGAIEAAATPPGTVVAFAGTTPPPGWLSCDGRMLPRAGMYARLFGAIGTAWGGDATAMTFNLPDLRGRFLRGVDGDAGVDPDRDTRTASRDGGVTGNNVGTLQGDQFRSHTHGVPSVTNSGGDEGFQYYFRMRVASTPSEAAGGSETRPVNAAVNYIIRY